MTLDIRHVRVVLAVAEEGTLTRATSRLGIPQSALSTQMSRIERAVGARLFIRSPRGTSRTENLERLMPYLRAVDSAMQILEEVIRCGVPRSADQFEVGLASADFADALATICRPSSVTVTTFVVTTADACLQQLCDDKLAFVLFYGTPSIPFKHTHKVRTATVGEETLCALLPSGHRLAHRESIGLTELVNEQWISYPLWVEQHNPLSAVCAMHGFTPLIRYRAATELAARDLVRDCGCVTIGSPHAARAGICVRPLDVRLTRRLVAAWNLSKCPHAIAQHLCAALRSWYQEAGGMASSR